MWLANGDASLRRRLSAIGLLGGVVTLTLAWLLIETSLLADVPIPRDVFWIAIYAVPPGVTALVVRQTRSHYPSLLAITGLTAAIVAAIVLQIDAVFFPLSFLLFALPAIVAARADAGVLPAIALTVLPIAGYAFAGPGGRSGPLSLADRIYGTTLLVAAVGLVAVGLYYGVRVTSRIVNRSRNGGRRPGTR
jgi:hypothetical protein